MTPVELNRLTKGIKALKRKDGPIGESSKKASVEEISSAVPTQAAPTLEATAAVPSPTCLMELLPPHFSSGKEYGEKVEEARHQESQEEP